MDAVVRMALSTALALLIAFGVTRLMSRPQKRGQHEGTQDTFVVRVPVFLRVLTIILFGLCLALAIFFVASSDMDDLLETITSLMLVFVPLLFLPILLMLIFALNWRLEVHGDYVVARKMLKKRTYPVSAIVSVQEGPSNNQFAPNTTSLTLVFKDAKGKKHKFYCGSTLPNYDLLTSWLRKQGHHF